jgi:hypothetical protein
MASDPVVHAAHYELTPAERMALDFLARQGEDCIGVVDDEGKFAAAMVFTGLDLKGLVTHRPGPDGPIASLTAEGRRIAASPYAQPQPVTEEEGR